MALQPIKATDLDMHKDAAYLFYGEPKTGKTLLGSQFPKKIALIDFEHGHMTVRGQEGIDIYPMYQIDEALQWAEFEALISHLALDTTVKTILIDNLEYLGLACMAHVMKRVKTKSGMPEHKDWGIYAIFLRKIIERVRDLAQKTLIITAHVRTDTTDKGAPIRGCPNLSGSLRYSVGGMFNEYYKLSTQTIGGGTPKFYINARGDNVYSCGSRLIDSSLTRIEWTQANGYDLIKSHMVDKIVFQKEKK